MTKPMTNKERLLDIIKSCPVELCYFESERDYDLYWKKILQHLNAACDEAVKECWDYNKQLVGTQKAIIAEQDERLEAAVKAERERVKGKCAELRINQGDNLCPPGPERAKGYNLALVDIKQAIEGGE